MGNGIIGSAHSIWPIQISGHHESKSLPRRNRFGSGGRFQSSHGRSAGLLPSHKSVWALFPRREEENARGELLSVVIPQMDRRSGGNVGWGGGGLTRHNVLSRCWGN